MRIRNFEIKTDAYCYILNRWGTRTNKITGEKYQAIVHSTYHRSLLADADVMTEEHTRELAESVQTIEEFKLKLTAKLEELLK